MWGEGLLVLVIHPTLKCHEFFPPTLIEVLGTLEGKELHLISKQKKAIVERTVKIKEQDHAMCPSRSCCAVQVSE